MADEQLNKGQKNLEVDELYIVSLDGNKKDLRQHYTEIRVFETLFLPTMTADIVIRDPENIIGDLPIVGSETIHMKLRTSTFPDDSRTVIKRSWQVAAITNRTPNNDRSQNYVLKLVPGETMRDAAQTLNKAMPGPDGDTNTAALAENIFKEYIGLESRYLPDGDENELTIAGTPHTSSIQYISNSWTPYQNLNYICKKIEGADVVGSDYFFFETNKNYYIASLQHLIQEGLESYFEEYAYVPASLPFTPRQDGNFSGMEVPSWFCEIEKLTIPRTIHMIEGNVSGYFSSNIQAYDMFNKKFKHFVLDIHNDFPNYVTTDTNIPVPKGINKSDTAYTSVALLNSYGNNGAEQSQGLNDDALNAHWASDAIRAQYINSFNDYQFLIDVPGRTDVEVGRSIKFNYPAPKSKSAEDNTEDKVLSGLYLITEIKHKINPEIYTMTMRITKNGVGKSLGGSDGE